MRIIGDERAISHIVDVLHGDDDGYVRWYAIETLSVIGNESIVASLIKTLEDYEPDPFIREALVIALGKLGTDEAIQVLREALYDEEVFVGDAAAGALEEIGSEKALIVLEEWVLGRDEY